MVTLANVTSRAIERRYLAASSLACAERGRFWEQRGQNWMLVKLSGINRELHMGTAVQCGLKTLPAVKWSIAGSEKTDVVILPFCNETV